MHLDANNSFYSCSIFSLCPEENPRSKSYNGWLGGLSALRQIKEALNLDAFRERTSTGGFLEGS